MTTRLPGGALTRRRFLKLAAMAGLAGAATWRGHLEAALPVFEEIPSAASGITWIHENAMSPDRYLPETMGPGVAFVDYDNDGWMDLFMVNSGPADFFTPKTPLKNALYKNNRDGTFTDVTDQAGVAGNSFAMGVAVGDFDNDGYADLLVTSYGLPTLYKNNGNGTFTDITKAAGLDGAPHWTTSAVWFDYDNDGKLDLFLCSFVEFSLKNNIFCGDNTLGKRFYCIPRVFKPTPSALYRNNGDGSFTLTSGGHRYPARPRQGPRRRRDRYQRRRADGPLCRERHRAELPLCESRQREVGRNRPRRRSRLQRQRHPAIGDGRRRR